MSIPNPPDMTPGNVPYWNGSEWIIVPPEPLNVPSGYEPVWDGAKYVIVQEPSPTPDQITASTIKNAVINLQVIAYLTTAEMSQHITPESRQEVTDYIHAVANILATAQSKYGTGEAYAPTFPPMPTAMPQLGGDGLPAPYIQFIVVN